MDIAMLTSSEMVQMQRLLTNVLCYPFIILSDIKKRKNNLKAPIEHLETLNIDRDEHKEYLVTRITLHLFNFLWYIFGVSIIFLLFPWF